MCPKLALGLGKSLYYASILSITFRTIFFDAFIQSNIETVENHTKPFWYGGRRYSTSYADPGLKDAFTNAIFLANYTMQLQCL
jgi:hypothetical protein